RAARQRRAGARRRRAPGDAVDRHRPARLRKDRGIRDCATGPVPRRRGSVAAAMSTAFVTGASGFIGGALTKRLVAEGWRVNARAGGAVVIRPRLVWGPGDKTILPTLADAVRRKRFAWVDGGRHRTSTAHIDNVVEGLLLGAQKGEPGEAYFVTDGESQVFHDFITDLLATQGIAIPERSVPRAVIGAAAFAGEAAWRVLPLPGQPPVTRFGYWFLTQECTIDISRARRDLGYSPVTSVPQGMQELRST